MIPLVKGVSEDNLVASIKDWLAGGQLRRLAFVTSIDGGQLAVLLLDPLAGAAELWFTPLKGNSYKSLTLSFASCHWFERAIWDMFGLDPIGHPRLKHLLLHESYEANYYPLRANDLLCHATENDRCYEFLEVKGEGVYEIPVGPIHAGIIEPGHFRFSCFGENILNLEIRLGYLHRGIEKQLTEVDWRKARFVAEAAASDTAVANALAHAIAVESICEIDVPPLADALRTIALELERLSMHIIDVGGMAADIGFLGVSSSMSSLRGKSLAIAQALSGNRFMRGFVTPGGVSLYRAEEISGIRPKLKELANELKPVLNLFRENQTAIERMASIGVISKALVEDFGIVGVAARATDVAYDTRQYFRQGLYPEFAPNVTVEASGDILSRTLVRMGEIDTSIKVIDRVLDSLDGNACSVELPKNLRADMVGLGVVEAFRGELIHLICTDSSGKIKRYAIKDPSQNNWTALSIAIRNNLIADFPLCNKSFSLSYGGNDL